MKLFHVFDMAKQKRNKTNAKKYIYVNCMCIVHARLEVQTVSGAICDCSYCLNNVEYVQCICGGLQYATFQLHKKMPI